MNPAWFHNLRARPGVSAEIGTETIDVRARVLSPDEREPIWQEQKGRYPGFADYEKKTERVIPVVLLTRR